MLVFRVLDLQPGGNRLLWWSPCYSFSLTRCLGTCLTKQMTNTTNFRFFNEKSHKTPSSATLTNLPEVFASWESQCNNKTNTDMNINCANRPQVCKRTTWMGNYLCSHKTLMLRIGAAFLQLAKSCRSNTAAHIFQLNKTDNLKTIIKIIWSGCKSDP